MVTSLQEPEGLCQAPLSLRGIFQYLAFLAVAFPKGLALAHILLFSSLDKTFCKASACPSSSSGCCSFTKATFSSKVTPSKLACSKAFAANLVLPELLASASGISSAFPSSVSAFAAAFSAMAGRFLGRMPKHSTRPLLSLSQTLQCCCEGGQPEGPWQRSCV